MRADFFFDEGDLWVHADCGCLQGDMDGCTRIVGHLAEETGWVHMDKF